MAEQRLVGLAYDTAEQAQDGLLSAMRLQGQELLRVHDYVMITRAEDGTARATPQSAFGELVEEIVTGTARGIPRQLAGELQELAKPGQTVLTLLVSDVVGMAVIEELRRFRSARVVYAPLDLQKS